MAALLSYLQRENLIHSQLCLLPQIPCKEVEMVTEFCEYAGICDLRDVSTDTLVSYRDYVREKYTERGMAEHYGGVLEKVVRQFLLKDYKDLEKEINECFGTVSHCPRAKINKMQMFLMVSHIPASREISYDVRCEYEKYLEDTSCSHEAEYVKALDSFKLFSIKGEQEKGFLGKNPVRYADSKLYLPYYPDSAIAQDFYFSQDKKELVFDFSLPFAGSLKREVFSFLVYALTAVKDKKTRRQLYILPLRKLYLFAGERGVSDLLNLTSEDIRDYRRCVDDTPGQSARVYMQIIYTARRFLFLSSDTIRWDADIWFLERLNLKDGRKSPAEGDGTLFFGPVRTKENRDLFKKYERYELGIGHLALNTIRYRFYSLLHFLLFLDESGILLKDLSRADFEKYLDRITQEGRSDTVINRMIYSADLFLGYLSIKGYRDRNVVRSEDYRKSGPYYHKERSLSKKEESEFLSCLVHFPVHLRLMCLTLWATGIRVSELCTLKGGDFEVRDGY